MFFFLLILKLKCQIKTCKSGTPAYRRDPLSFHCFRLRVSIAAVFFPEKTVLNLGILGEVSADLGGTPCCYSSSLVLLEVATHYLLGFFPDKVDVEGCPSPPLFGICLILMFLFLTTVVSRAGVSK